MQIYSLHIVISLSQVPIHIFSSLIHEWTIYYRSHTEDAYICRSWILHRLAVSEAPRIRPRNPWVYKVSRWCSGIPVFGNYPVDFSSLISRQTSFSSLKGIQLALAHQIEHGLGSVINPFLVRRDERRSKGTNILYWNKVLIAELTIQPCLLGTICNYHLGCFTHASLSTFSSFNQSLFFLSL